MCRHGVDNALFAGMDRGQHRLQTRAVTVGYNMMADQNQLSKAGAYKSAHNNNKSARRTCQQSCTRAC